MEAAVNDGIVRISGYCECMGGGGRLSGHMIPDAQKGWRQGIVCWQIHVSKLRLFVAQPYTAVEIAIGLSLATGRSQVSKIN